MAITDIISEEEIRAPNLEIAQGGPEDFMTDDEMDPYQDPEFQQLLESLPGEQAEVLMQLIKEFKAMVAQGFEGEFEDFVKMKMASAQGGPEDFMSEEEMQIGPEEQQAILPMGQQAAYGGRIGYQNAGPVGGIIDVVEEGPPPDIDTPQQRIMDWLEAHNLPPTPENIQKAIVAMAREGQGPVKGTRFGSHMDIPQMQMPGPPTGEGYVPEELIGQTGAEIVEMTPRGTEVVSEEEDIYSDQEMREMKQKFLEQGGTFSDPPSEDVEEAGIMQIDKPITYTDDEATYTDDEKNEWLKRGERLKTYKKGLPPDSYLYLEDEWQKEGVNKGFQSEDDYLNYQMPFFGEYGERRTGEIDRYRDWAGLAQGGRIGYDYGGEVTADAPGVRSQVSPYAEGNQMAEEALNKIILDFYRKFPEASEEDIQQLIRNYIAEEQFEGVMGTQGAGILDIHEGAKMITPESVRGSMPGVTRRFAQGGRIGYQGGGITDLRQAYGIGDIVKSVFKGGKKLVKGLTKSVKKFAKSDLGKMALMYMATAGLGNIGAGGLGGAQPWSKGAWLKPSNVMGLGKTGWGNIGKSYTNLFSKSPAITEASKAVTGVVHPSQAKTLPYLYKKTPAVDKTLMQKFAGSFKDNPFPWILGTSGAAGLYTKMNPGKDNLDALMRNYKGEVKEWDDMIADIRAGKIQTPFSTSDINYPYPDYSQYAAEGGRIGRAEGGLMDLGGMEKDYRAEGGFVPIGGKEKADDVPARLSRNEFVFTADAVRNAGGGDVDRGSEVMQNIMTNLEQGGNISEESQGLEGARDMFEVSERLSEVV